MSNNYYQSQATASIQDLFQESFSKECSGDLVKNENQNIRSKMFDFFKTKPFLDLYFELALSVADNLGLSRDNIVLQTQPTPRVFNPGDHGTSFHSDYWYGHGETVYTIWTPLSDIDIGNTFWICNPDKNSYYFNELANKKGFVDIENQLLSNSFPALPPKGSSVVFNSKVIHGSPENTSSKQRVSFDFRIGYANDPTSTKDLANYYRYMNGEFKHLLRSFNGKKNLKYICGGKEKNTAAQHICIEAIAKEYQINIQGQEAEVERFGHVMFIQYLEGLAEKKGFDGIVLASKSILTSNEIELSKKSKIDIFCALENEFLNKIDFN